MDASFSGKVVDGYVTAACRVRAHRVILDLHVFVVPRVRLEISARCEPWECFEAGDELGRGSTGLVRALGARFAVKAFANPKDAQRELHVSRLVGFSPFLLPTFPVRCIPSIVVLPRAQPLRRISGHEAPLFARWCARALLWLSYRGLAYEDLKPTNVVVVGARSWCLCDAGSVNRFPANSAARLCSFPTTLFAPGMCDSFTIQRGLVWWHSRASYLDSLGSHTVYPVDVSSIANVLESPSPPQRAGAGGQKRKRT